MAQESAKPELCGSADSNGIHRRSFRDIRSMEFAHDLKTPIQLICACAQMLEAEIDPSPRASRYLQMLTQSADQLRRMALRTLEADEGCDLVWIVRLLADQFSLLCEKKDITLCFTSNVDALRMKLDRVRIERILQNLFANALRFTPKGGRIGMEIIARSDFVEISVSDTGNGIAPEIRERIFDPGVSSDSTGLGLPAARTMAKAMGGDVLLESASEAGSRFALRVPLAGA